MGPQIQESLPKYVQIANFIRDRILRGELRPGDEVPSERQLAEEWGVSRPTTVKALSVLRVEGLVDSRQGAGTYVKSRPQLSRRARDRYSRARATGRIYTGKERAEIIEAEETTAPEAVALALGLETGAPVARRRRVVFDEDRPVEVSTSWFASETARLAPRLTERSRIIEGTLAYVEQSTSRRASTAIDRVAARMATVEERALLQLGDDPAAALLVHHVVYDHQGEPLEFAEAVYPQGRWSFEEEYSVDAR